MIKVSFFRNDGFGDKLVARREYPTHWGLELTEQESEQYMNKNGYDGFEIDNPWDCWEV